MEPFRRVLPLAVLCFVATPIYSTTTNVYFSDYADCDVTYNVGRDDIIQIEAKSSSSGSSAFTDCPLLFRAGQMEDTLCVKISTLTFTNTNLELQYFETLDPSTGTPTETYDRVSTYSTPIEICSNQYEISMKLRSLVADATINDVDALITVFNMQGTKRIAYMDEDCSTTFKLRDSTINVQNINPNGTRTKVDVCHLYFEYVGTNSDKTVCLNYTRIKENVCDYSLKVMDGPASEFTHAHTYNCTQTTPQTWCSTRTTLQLELLNAGTTGLPENTFSLEVKDDVKASVDGNWGNWGSWTECSKTCGVGQKSRTRQCNNPPPNGGSSCQGDSADQATCNEGTCQGTSSGLSSFDGSQQSLLTMVIVGVVTFFLTWRP